jgi:competence protein ComEC
MILEKPNLFTQTSHFIVFVVTMVLIISLRLGWDYRSYQEFIQKPFFYSHAEVVNSYPKTKNGKTYTILKLRIDDAKTIYTTTYSHDDFAHKKVYMKFMPSAQIGFWDYLGGMYCKSRIKRVEPADITISYGLEKKIESQHIDKNMQSFYKAIFLATPIPKSLREKIASLGVSHLVALSGFHLGILWGVLYAILLFFYKPFQQRYFPYRYSLVDIGIVVMVALGYYLWLTGFPPSLVRSYAMLLVGWMMLLMGIELVSFTFLSTIALVLLALFPSLVVSLSFWLSIAGVYYIFLMLKYCSGAKTWLISIICIPIGIFILMQPVVHHIFGLTTPYQLLSPALSIMFIVFYPVAFLVHLVGYGSLFDSMLESLFSMPMQIVDGSDIIMPLWGLALYILISFWAIWSTRVFYILIAVSSVYLGYLILSFFALNS